MSPVSPDQALRELVAGNQRYFVGRLTHPHQDVPRRREIAGGQHPFAAVLGCADSRVAPEIVFDQGLGDLFVVRVAGNIVDDAVLGSLEYAVEHLHVPLVMVLGHTKCGAVTAAVEGGAAHGHIGALVNAIAPAVARTTGQVGDRVKQAARINVDLAVEQLSAAPLLYERLHTGLLKIVGASYDVDGGTVTIF